MSKTVLITGATSGIGKACAEIFAKNNFNLILTGRREERLVELEEQLYSENKSIKIQTLCFDVQNFEACKNAIEQIDKNKFESIDIVINNAGLAAGLSTIDNGDLQDWETMIDTNVKGLLYISKLIFPILKNQKKGHIINIGSIAGKYVYANGNVYCASKHAVVALSESMRIELLPYNIKVTCVNPGAVETEFSLVRFKGNEQKAKSVYEGFKPLSAEDVANSIFYCANLPNHVCINEITLTCTTQANSFYSIKNQ